MILLPFVSFLVTRLPPSSTLFPYTTLFRSDRERVAARFTSRGFHGVAFCFAFGFGQERGAIDFFQRDRVLKSVRLNYSHVRIVYVVVSWDSLSRGLGRTRELLRRRVVGLALRPC